MSLSPRRTTNVELITPCVKYLVSVYHPVHGVAAVADDNQRALSGGVDRLRNWPLMKRREKYLFREFSFSEEKSVVSSNIRSITVGVVVRISPSASELVNAYSD